MKESLDLKQVVLLGRTWPEYLLAFGLDAKYLEGKNVLDVAAGVSSFTAKGSAKGFNIVAADPIYARPPEEIGRASATDLEAVADQIGKVRAYRWKFYKDPEGMKEYRARARETFLRDFSRDRTRYVPAALPTLPFQAGDFDLALVSYLLFVYEEQFDLDFHRRSLLELARVATEIRIYPIVNFKAEKSRMLEAIRGDPVLKHLAFEVVRTDFEFLAGSNNYLRITRTRP